VVTIDANASKTMVKNGDEFPVEDVSKEAREKFDNEGYQRTGVLRCQNVHEESMNLSQMGEALADETSMATKVIEVNEKLDAPAVVAVTTVPSKSSPAKPTAVADDEIVLANTLIDTESQDAANAPVSQSFPELSPLQTVSCGCGLNDLTGKMLKCFNCLQVQHSICYALLLPDDKNGEKWLKSYKHVCRTCYMEVKKPPRYLN
jgi:hypothetical protein